MLSQRINKVSIFAGRFNQYVFPPTKTTSGPGASVIDVNNFTTGPPLAPITLITITASLDAYNKGTGSVSSIVVFTMASVVRITSTASAIGSITVPKGRSDSLIDDMFKPKLVSLALGRPSDAHMFLKARTYPIPVTKRPRDFVSSKALGISIPSDNNCDEKNSQGCCSAEITEHNP